MGPDRIPVDSVQSLHHGLQSRRHANEESDSVSRDGSVAPVARPRVNRVHTQSSRRTELRSGQHGFEADSRLSGAARDQLDREPRSATSARDGR